MNNEDVVDDGAGPADGSNQAPNTGTSTPDELSESVFITISEIAHKENNEKCNTQEEFLSKKYFEKPSDRKKAGVVESEFHDIPYRRRLLSGARLKSRGVSSFSKDFARVVHSHSFRKLQGKSQLIPSDENEFFRTRLTHSIEVAEIAARIAIQLRHELNDRGTRCPPEFLHRTVAICSGLLHDIGHPPFGHSGEHALDARMKKYGGFEGNAQTLRLVTALENRLGLVTSISEVRKKPRGLNLTVGVLASIIKYDACIWSKKKDSTDPSTILSSKKKDSTDPPPIQKGYYESEKKIVDDVKRILEVPDNTPLYTIECQVMDIADDIAYSAYDLEDTMEAGIVTPFDFLTVSDESLEKITENVNRGMSKRGVKDEASQADVQEVLSRVFDNILIDADRKSPYELNDNLYHRKVFVGRSYQESVMHAKNPLIRRQFLEAIIQLNVNAIGIEYNEDKPFLSKLTIERESLMRIECMKAYNFHKVISSRQLQMPHHRSSQVIGYLFDELAGDAKFRIFSEYDRSRLVGLAKDDETGRMRIISDIIASMTDREAIRLFKNLKSLGETSIFGYKSS